jgi:hypothetical protein
MIKRNIRGRFVRIPTKTRNNILVSLKNSSDPRFGSYSKIAKHFKVSKSTILNVNKKSGIRDGRVFAVINNPRTVFSRNLNIVRLKEIRRYVKAFGLMSRGKRVEGVSVNFLIDYLKSRGISPGVKKNLGNLLDSVVSEFEAKGFFVVRRSKSDQPKRGKGNYIIKSH